MLVVVDLDWGVDAQRQRHAPQGVVADGDQQRGRLLGPQLRSQFDVEYFSALNAETLGWRSNLASIANFYTGPRTIADRERIARRTYQSRRHLTDCATFNT